MAPTCAHARTLREYERRKDDELPRQRQPEPGGKRGDEQRREHRKIAHQIAHREPTVALEAVRRQLGLDLHQRRNALSIRELRRRSHANSNHLSLACDHAVSMVVVVVVVVRTNDEFFINTNHTSTNPQIISLLFWLRVRFHFRMFGFFLLSFKVRLCSNSSGSRPTASDQYCHRSATRETKTKNTNVVDQLEKRGRFCQTRGKPAVGLV